MDSNALSRNLMVTGFVAGCKPNTVKSARVRSLARLTTASPRRNRLSNCGIGANRGRPSRRLRPMPKKLAEVLRVKIETLATAKIVGADPWDEVSGWVAELDDSLAAKLPNLGLIAAREQTTDESTSAGGVFQRLHHRTE